MHFHVFAKASKASMFLNFFAFDEHLFHAGGGWGVLVLGTCVATYMVSLTGLRKLVAALESGRAEAGEPGTYVHIKTA